MQILQQDDLIIGFLLGTMQRAGAVDPLVIAGAIIGAAISIVISLLLCWDLSKQTVDDTAVVGWVIIFFLVPVISWIAYWLVIRMA